MTNLAKENSQSQEFQAPSSAESNAALLLHAWNLGKAIVPYTDTLISDLQKTVTRVVPPSPTANEWDHFFANEWDHFLREGGPSEFEHDVLAEDEL